MYTISISSDIGGNHVIELHVYVISSLYLRINKVFVDFWNYLFFA